MLNHCSYYLICSADINSLKREGLSLLHCVAFLSASQKKVLILGTVCACELLIPVCKKSACSLCCPKDRVPGLYIAVQELRAGLTSPQRGDQSDLRFKLSNFILVCPNKHVVL